MIYYLFGRWVGCYLDYLAVYIISSVIRQLDIKQWYLLFLGLNLHATNRYEKNLTIKMCTVDKPCSPVQQ